MKILPLWSRIHFHSLLSITCSFTTKFAQDLYANCPCHGAQKQGLHWQGNAVLSKEEAVAAGWQITVHAKKSEAQLSDLGHISLERLYAHLPLT